MKKDFHDINLLVARDSRVLQKSSWSPVSVSMRSYVALAIFLVPSPVSPPSYSVESLPPISLNHLLSLIQLSAMGRGLCFAGLTVQFYNLVI